MYDSNSPTPSISISQSPYASEHGLNNAVRRNSSSSLGISEELAFIKREVASLKDQVWNRAHNDFLPSEDCSIQNSFTEGQPDQSYNDERGLRNRGGRDSLYSSSHASGPQNQASSITKQPVLASRSGESSAYASELERNNPCDITLGQLELNNNVKCDKEMLYNGIIIEGTLAIEANMYTVTSVNNGLNQSQRRKTSYFNPLIMIKLEVDPTSNGLEEINLKPLPLLTSTSHLSLNSSKPKFKEMVSVIDENDRKKVMFTDIASQHRITTENDEPVLLSANNRLLDDDQGSEEAVDHRGMNPLLKKTLSVIFSTNESIETTPPQSIVRRTEIQEEITPLKLLQMETHKETKYPNDSIRIEGNEERTVEDSCATSRSEDKKSSKEVLITESNGTIMMTEGVSSLGSEETFMGLLCVTKLQNKSNRSLEEKLNRMADLHNKQIEKYEKTIQILNEKNEKYMKGNELLVKTLRTCEKEIDSLALNNQTLHKNLLMFEEDMSKKRIKEKQLIESNNAKQKEIEKLREDLKKKEIELEESKKSFIIDNKKVETAKVYAKSCEDSIAAIDQTLRRILSDKGGPKMSLIIINKVLESIFAETSKFVGRVERSATVPIPTIETESKSPSRKDNARCFTSIGTEDTVSTFDYRDRITQSQSAHKQRSKTPDTHSTAMSPKGRAPRSLKTLPESPTSATSEKKGLIQKLMTSSGNLNQKGVLNSVRRSFDHRRSSEREGGFGDSSILRQTQNNGNTIFRRESVCTSSISKTPDNKKSRINTKVAPEMDRIKENLRRKVLSHVSLTPKK